MSNYINTTVNQQRPNLTNLYVKNFGKDINETELCQLFGTYGMITSCKIQMDNKGQSRGFGFVNFERPEMAQNAMMNLNGRVLDGGQQLYVGFFQSKPERQKEIQRIREENRRKQSNSLTLYVSNLDRSIDEKLLEVIFNKFGRITHTHLLRYGSQSKGIGFISFNTTEEATRALNEMNGKWILSKPIYVTLSTNIGDSQWNAARPSTPCMPTTNSTSPDTPEMPYLNMPTMFYVPTFVVSSRSNNYSLPIAPLNLQIRSSREYSPRSSSMMASSMNNDTNAQFYRNLPQNN
ncbi:unnamed protein product [Rotaria magnacalcarata]|uniref:RRM domain-containing protein n=1 Tax=Rotaria magnacalcarata TaxID=392030 RepID=A0A816RE13_9BILA|nr:unnamed protein product [Rotaria magnacalcarata]CAF1659600.1 unnamed protein product [Rotaria magnacalcarata]CAF1928584.1 unnamed protein product [Rotaria magnacalcarata]CAF2061135.1 unnamed protein product [Rotaria magnacalcarata]CAF2069587.1 unnamed protein product [Rotaria magnacalcarata]